MSKPTRLQLIPERATYSTVVNYYDAAEMDAWLTDTVLPVLEDAAAVVEQYCPKGIADRAYNWLPDRLQYRIKELRNET